MGACFFHAGLASEIDFAGGWLAALVISNDVVLRTRAAFARDGHAAIPSALLPGALDDLAGGESEVLVANLQRYLASRYTALAMAELAGFPQREERVGLTVGGCREPGQAPLQAKLGAAHVLYAGVAFAPPAAHGFAAAMGDHEHTSSSWAPGTLVVARDVAAMRRLARPANGCSRIVVERYRWPQAQ